MVNNPSALYSRFFSVVAVVVIVVIPHHCLELLFHIYADLLKSECTELTWPALQQMILNRWAMLAVCPRCGKELPSQSIRFQIPQHRRSLVGLKGWKIEFITSKIILKGGVLYNTWNNNSTIRSRSGDQNISLSFYCFEIPIVKVTGHPFWRFAENRYCALKISPIFIKFSSNVSQCVQNMVKL